MKSPTLLLVLALAGSTAAHAATLFTLNFGGLRNNEQVLNFYNGGTGSLGSGPGGNFGITFSPSFTAISATPPYGPNTVGNLNGSSAIMDVAGGLITRFSFYYEAANNLGSVSLWSGLDGTGTQLANFALRPAAFWTPSGGSFSGTAYSVVFSGTPGTTFDQLTDTELVLPEPSSLLLLATGTIGLVLQGRRRRVSQQTA